MSRRHAAQPPAAVPAPAAAGHRPHGGQAATGQPHQAQARQVSESTGEHGQAARRSPADTEAAALAALAANPAMTHRQLGAAIGVSERTARRVRARLAATPNDRPQAADPGPSWR